MNQDFAIVGFVKQWAGPTVTQSLPLSGSALSRSHSSLALYAQPVEERTEAPFCDNFCKVRVSPTLQSLILGLHVHIKASFFNAFI